MTKVDFVRAIRTGNQVVLTYEAQTTVGRVFRNTEVFTIRAGQIAAVAVHFGWNVPHDAEPGGCLYAA